MRYIFLWISLCFVWACQRSAQHQQKQNKLQITGSESYTISEISDKAWKEISVWNNFRSMYYIMKQLSPSSIHFTQKTIVKPDSLILYKRLYPKSSLVVSNNIFIDKDWHTPSKLSDTIYRITSDDKNLSASLHWTELLLQDIPYQIELLACKSNSSNVSIQIEQNNHNTLLFNRNFNLDSLQTDLPPSSSNTLNWKTISASFTPKTTDKYLISITLPPGQNNLSAPSILILSPVIRVKNQDIAKLNYGTSSSKDTLPGILLWIDQLDNEIHYLLVENQFPEKLNTPAFKSRLRYLQTLVKQLKDDIKNLSNITQQSLSQRVINIGKGFNSVINNINTTYNDRLEVLINQAPNDSSAPQQIKSL